MSSNGILLIIPSIYDIYMNFESFYFLGNYINFRFHLFLKLFMYLLILADAEGIPCRPFTVEEFLS